MIPLIIQIAAMHIDSPLLWQIGYMGSLIGSVVISARGPEFIRHLIMSSGGKYG